MAESRVRIWAGATDYIDPSWCQFMPQDNPAAFVSQDISGRDLFAVPVDTAARLPQASRATLLIHKDDMTLLNSLGTMSIYEWLIHNVRDARNTFYFYVQGVYSADRRQRVVTRYYEAKIAGIPAWMLGHLGDFEGDDAFLTFEIPAIESEGWVNGEDHAIDAASAVNNTFRTDGVDLTSDLLPGGTFRIEGSTDDVHDGPWKALAVEFAGGNTTITVTGDVTSTSASGRIILPGGEGFDIAPTVAGNLTPRTSAASQTVVSE